MSIHYKAKSYFFDERFEIRNGNVSHYLYGIQNEKYNQEWSAVMDLKKIPKLFIRKI